MRRATFLSIALLLTATTLIAAPRAERERRPFPRAAGRQTDPVVATNGEDFFALWTDTRGGAEEIYGTIIRRDGEVLAPFGINVAFPDTGSDPAVAWDGRGYVVVWRSAKAVRAARFDAAGQRLEAPRTLTEDCPYCTFSLASGGSSTLVAILGFGEPRLIALDRDGRTVHETTLAINGARGLAAATFRDGFAIFGISAKSELLMWHSDASGRLLDASPRVLTSKPPKDFWTRGVQAAAIDGRVLVTFASYSLDYSFPIGVRNASVVGLLGDGDVFSEPFSIAPAGTADFALTTQRDGFTLAVPRETGRIDVPPAGDVIGPQQPVFDLDAYHVSRAGVVRRGARLATGSDSDINPAIAGADDMLFVAWEEHALLAGRHKIAGAISHGAHDALPVDIALSATYQSIPAIAGGIDGFLAVWQEEPLNDSRNEIMARTESGRAVRLSTEGGNHNPAVAFDGKRYLVTWIERFKVIGRLVDVDGSPAGAPFMIAPFVDPNERPAVASNGDGFLVVYGERYPVPPYGTRKLYVAHVSRDGVVSPSNLDITASISIHGELQLDTDGFTWMLSRNEECRLVVERFVTQRGGPSLRLPTATAKAELCKTPALACTREQCAVADWERGNVVVSLAPPNFGTVATFPSPRPDPLMLLAIGYSFVPFARIGDRIDMLMDNAVRRVVEARLLGEYAIAGNARGKIAIAYEAPVPIAFGAKRVHVRVIE